jgi:CHASE3 domain sensor protein
MSNLLIDALLSTLKQLYEASNREPQVTTSPEYQALLRQQEIHEADKARLVADVINLRRDLDEKSITLRVLESSRAPTQNELTIRMNEIRQLTERLKTSEHEKEALEQKVEEAKTAQHSPELVQSLLDRNAGLTTESAALRKQVRHYYHSCTFRELLP